MFRSAWPYRCSPCLAPLVMPSLPSLGGLAALATNKRALSSHPFKDGGTGPSSAVPGYPCLPPFALRPPLIGHWGRRCRLGQASRLDADNAVRCHGALLLFCLVLQTSRLRLCNLQGKPSVGPNPLATTVYFTSQVVGRRDGRPT